MPSNPKHANSKTVSCPFQQWELVVHGDESDPKYRGALAHVESCSECQARIDAVASTDFPWWSEAKNSWLESELPSVKDDSVTSSIVIEVQSEMPDDSRVEFETVTLSFLEPPSHPELLGRLGRYEIERVIGTGGMGIVLKAHDTELHRVVAIKVLAAHLAHNASARKRFAREAQAAAAVLHPNVIPIYNVESDGKLPYLVMQCVSGQSLQSKVDHHGPLPLADALRIAKQTAAGLSAAHDQGLVHRDVKPANILLEENVDRVLLSDFGLARAVDDASLTRTGVVAGTPHYMSPEQARGDAIDTRSDQFSLGSVMYFMLTGRPPFRASGAMGVLNRICTEEHRCISQINHEIPDQVLDLINRLMAKSAANRFGSMADVTSELERLLEALQSGGLSLQKRKKVRPKIAFGKALKRSLAFAIPILCTAAVTAAFLWKPDVEPQVVTKVVTIDVAKIKNQVNEQVQKDVEMASEIGRIRWEVQNVFAPTSLDPSWMAPDRFKSEIESIQRQIDMFQQQYSTFKEE